MKCNVCNFDNPPEEKDFCQKCGSPLSAQVATPISAPVPAVSLEAGQQAPAPLEIKAPEVAAAPAPAAVAKLVIPGKGEMNLQTLPKNLGREDFVKFLSPDDSKFISRGEHIKISLADDKFFVQDDKSVNGTKLNGDEIKGMGPKELKSDDKINLADVLTVTFQRLN